MNIVLSRIIRLMKSWRMILDIAFLVFGIVFLIIGILDESKIGRLSLILGCLSLIGRHLSSYFLSSRLSRIEKTITRDEAVDYVETVYELYSRARSSDVIYSCTSSWIISEKVFEILKDIDSNEIFFVGPILTDRQLYGALFRKWISDRRLAQSKPQFNIYHKAEGTVKFVLVGQKLVLSSANWQEESKIGFLYKEISIARNFRDLFKDIIINNTTHLEDVIFERFFSAGKKGLPFKNLVKTIIDAEEHPRYFPKHEIEQTLEKILISLQNKGKVYIKEKNGESIIEGITESVFSPKKFGFHEISSKMPALRLILNTDCNFDCYYCPDSNENYGGTLSTIIKEEDIEWIVETLIKHNFSAFRFSGGEPTLLSRHYIFRLSNLIRKNENIEFKLATNGYQLVDVIDLFSDLSANFTMKISLDSLEPEKIIKISRRNIDINKIIESITMCVNKGIRVGINTVVTTQNKDEIENILNFCKSEGVYLKLLDLDWYQDLPRGLWRENYQNMDIYYDRLNPYFIKETSTHGGYGILMKYYEISNETFVKIKDTKRGATYGNKCKECQFYPCQEGAYQLSITADLRLKVCRLRPDLGTPILQEVKNRDETNFLYKVYNILNDFFLSATRLNSEDMNKLQNNLSGY